MKVWVTAGTVVVDVAGGPDGVVVATPPPEPEVVGVVVLDGPGAVELFTVPAAWAAGSWSAAAGLSGSPAAEADPEPSTGPSPGAFVGIVGLAPTAGPEAARRGPLRSGRAGGGMVPARRMPEVGADGWRPEKDSAATRAIRARVTASTAHHRGRP